MLAVGAATVFFQSVSDIHPRREALSEGAERGCTQGDQQACQSMYANVRAANAADDIVDLAIWQFVIAIVGIYLIARTLKATQDAVSEARDATSAAEAALEITRVSNERQLRAYLNCTIGKARNLGARLEPEFDCVIHNAGQTNAYNVRYEHRVSLVVDGDPMPIPLEIGEHRGAMPLSPGRDFVNAKAADFCLTDEGWEKLKAGDAALAFSGLITYDDAFGKGRRLTWMHMFSGPKFVGFYHAHGNDCD